MTGPLLLTKQEAADVLRVSVRELDRLRRSGRLAAKRHGQKVLIPMAELTRYVENLPWENDQ